MTVQEGSAGYGSILKSNSNGTYFGVSIDYVNRDSYGYVDFEKMIGIDGVGLINVVANPRDAVASGHKAIQSRITHNDGNRPRFYFLRSTLNMYRWIVEADYTAED
jgi:hypothetical protein